MSFINSVKGEEFLAGHFLANNEDVTRITWTFKADDDAVVTLPSGKKIIPAGTVITDGDKISPTAIGVVYEDIDVTNGDAAGSLVVEGKVYADLISDNAPTNFVDLGDMPAVTRPYGVIEEAEADGGADSGTDPSNGQE